MLMNRPRFTFARSRAFSERLERLVPGGAHTYSKGRDQFPLAAPGGIKRASGAYLWDQDDNCLIDWGMGLTSVSIGHAYAPVDERVIAEIRKGVNFPRPAALELEAAESFLAAIGVDGMVKFAKHGSTVTTAAVKLARAFTGKRIVACPVEHPFFSFDDWFIASTPSDFGIPSEVRKYIRRFRYGDLEDLQRTFREAQGDIACVMMEPLKFDHPPDGYLQSVKELCHANGALFVLDEMVSGGKWAVGGGQAYFGVQADLSTWGKGIANGYACAALAGRADVMSLGGIGRDGERKLFLISTTHGAEATGLAAMIATFEAFRREDMIARNWATGTRLQTALRERIFTAGLDDHIRILGDPCLFVLEIRGRTPDEDAAVRTLWMQEMIGNGICTQGLFMPTVSHDDAVIEETVAGFVSALSTVRRAIESGVGSLLEGPPIKPVFRERV